MAEACEHLAGLNPADFPEQKTANACAECLTEGTFWVALRECQSCGQSLLRFFNRQARHQTLSRYQASRHARYAAGSLDVVLYP